MVVYIGALVLAALIIAWIIGRPLVRRRRRRFLQHTHVDDTLIRFLEAHWPVYRQLPAPLKRKLHGQMHIFLDEKAFYSYQGLRLTAPMKWLIAAQACLLIVNKDMDAFGKLQSVLVYPTAFYKHQNIADETGVVSRQRHVLSGESWETGKVVVSWDDVHESTLDPQDGYNVVIHEFAHQLDQASGDANGAPVLDRQEDYQLWSETFTQAFAQLQKAAEDRQPSVFSYYGALNPAEFFAVASEVFIERSHDLKQTHPALHAQLSRYYGFDPTQWQTPQS